MLLGKRLITPLFVLAVTCGVARTTEPAVAADRGEVAEALPADDDGMGETSHGTYVVDTAKRLVRVTMTTTVRNDVPNSGGRYYYFNGYTTAVPDSATHLRVTSEGAPLTLTVRDAHDGFKVVTAAFPDLLYGRSRTMVWSYLLPTGAFRSKTNLVRVGNGFATFPVSVAGDEGHTDVEITLPTSMRLTTAGGNFGIETWKTTKSTRTYTSSESTSKDGIWTRVSARDPDQADTRWIKLGGKSVKLQAFSGDRAWMRFAGPNAERAVATLERLLGVKWPGALDTIREDVSSEVTGYTWYDSHEDEIVLSEQLDKHALYHELAHVWINSDDVSERWLREGLAELAAYRGVAADGGHENPPTDANRHAKIAFPLLTWEPDEQASAADSYGYDASYTAVHDMVGGLDATQFAALMSDVHATRSAYGADVSGADEVDWKHFLDLVEAHGGTAEAEKALGTWVLTPSDRTLLAARATARASYLKVDGADGAWQPPLGLRDNMDSWDFPDAETAMAALGDAPAGAAALQKAAATYGLRPSPGVRKAYESAKDAGAYPALRTMLPHAATVTTQVGKVSRTVTTRSNPISRLGDVLTGARSKAADARHQLDRAQLDDAAASARRATSLAKWGLVAGIAAILLTIGLLVGLVLLVRMLVRRIPTRPRRGVPEPSSD